jgi:chromosome segregation ATPase
VRARVCVCVCVCVCVRRRSQRDAKIEALLQAAQEDEATAQALREEQQQLIASSQQKAREEKAAQIASLKTAVATVTSQLEVAQQEATEAKKARSTAGQRVGELEAAVEQGVLRETQLKEAVAQRQVTLEETLEELHELRERMSSEVEEAVRSEQVMLRPRARRGVCCPPNAQLTKVASGFN